MGGFYSFSFGEFFLSWTRWGSVTGQVSGGGEGVGGYAHPTVVTYGSGTVNRPASWSSCCLFVPGVSPAVVWRLHISNTFIYRT